MKLYLDNSFLNRPFDDLSIKRNRLEAGMLEMVIDWVKQSKAQLVNSSMIVSENAANPFPEKKEFVNSVMELATEYQNVNTAIYERAEMLETKLGIKPFDALHLASAEAAQVDLFITCDQEIVKKCKGWFNARTPLSAIQYYDYANNNSAFA